jgi:phthiocerol/phenolphthiocerol synthesis type-I polyketide synthase E
MTSDFGSIAIIGMSGAFPSAATVKEFWAGLAEGKEMIRFSGSAPMQPGSQKGRLVPAVACMDGIELFDAAFFGIPPAEAEIMDPQHRIFLEHCWSALEDAGYDPGRYPGAISVFGGATTNTYLVHHLASRPDLMQRLDHVQLNIANGTDFLTTRVSYKLNLRGPSHAVQSACSTSLVAVHCACRSLLDFESDMALAGGVSVNVTLLDGYYYKQGGIFSPDGHCRAFDAEAMGTVFGSGVGVVVLKRLKDALADGDSIHAVILGSAINNDGLAKVGFSAPGVEGQAQVITEALACAGVEAESISYVECHGTGTTIGDPIEIRALSKAFGKGEPDRCAIGSVKTNVGHLDAAAGVTALIKVVLGLKHKMLPPSLHFRSPNPGINFGDTPFYVNTTLKPWPDTDAPRRAGVSAFGVGGTNAHIVLEEAATRPTSRTPDTPHVLALAAKTETALIQMAGNLAEHLAKHPELDLGDVAYTLQVGRQRFSWRRATVCRNHEQAIAALSQAKNVPAGWGIHSERITAPVAFLFPGQGTQHIGMGRELYREEPVFRSWFDRCLEILSPLLQRNLADVLFHGASTADELDLTWLAQPALLAIEYSLAQLWMSWGVRPQVMMGHSLGEYTAACLAGVMTLDDALYLVAVRGRLMQQADPGAMLAVSLAASEVESRLPSTLTVAAVNAPDLCVIAGHIEHIADFEQQLQREGIMCQRLRTSHAFHSALVENAMIPFHKEFAKVRLQRPEIPFFSCVTGTWIQKEQTEDPAYWIRQMREPVRFDAAAREILREPRVLLEVGPGKTLCRLLRRQTDGRGAELVASLPTPGSADEHQTLLQGLGQLWEAGVLIDWPAVHQGQRQRISLPTYPFERRRYWVEPAFRVELQPNLETADTGSEQSLLLQENNRLRDTCSPPQNPIERTIVSILEKALGVHPISVFDKFGELGGDSLKGVRIVDEINSILHCQIQTLDLYEGVTTRELALKIASMSLDAEEDTETPASGQEEKMQRRQQYRLHKKSLRQMLQ